MLRETQITSQLSGRQIEILRKVARGKTYKEIGDAMNVSESTIKYHMNRIMFTLNVETRTEAILILQRYDRMHC